MITITVDDIMMAKLFKSDVASKPPLTINVYVPFVLFTYCAKVNFAKNLCPITIKFGSSRFLN